MTGNFNTPFTHENLDFRLKNEPIDYFHIDTSILSMGEFAVDEIDLSLQPNEYLTMEHLNTIDHNANETIVFNIPVGRGKTERCYDLIRKYYADGYYVIICSPFTKLVEKDYKKMREYFERHEVFNYSDIKDNRTYALTVGVNARIQVMTINCLLQNPSEDYYEQSFFKSDYLTYLSEIIRHYNKKIVFFFDEIHESVDNFKNEFIPNLLKWQSLTHKCYVSSATHTPASIPIIRYISYLTLCHIKIYFTRRIKGNVQSNLHLHISTEKYSGKSLGALNKLIQLISHYRSSNRKINILSGYKTIIESLVNRTDIRRPLVAKVRQLEPNICTADTRNEFNQQLNNIGTNFKTGVNIESNRGVFIIILPIISNEKANYGIFHDGVPSIIQSIARLRNGGDIHIFMYAPDTIIDLDGHREYLDEKLVNGKASIASIIINDSYTNFRERYDRKVATISNELELIASFELEEVSPELKYHYPTFQEELINKSQDILLRGHESFGKGLCSYVLWAAINNQFCNATLRTIELITKDYQNKPLTSGNLFEELLALLSTEQKQVLRGESFKLACISLFRYIQRSTITHTEEGNGSTEQVTVLNKFTYNGVKKNPSQLLKITAFNQAIVNVIYFLKKDEIRPISKETYIHTCISNALANPNGNIPDLIDAYTRLHNVKQQFSQFVIYNTATNRNSGNVIHIDSHAQLSDEFISECITTIRLLKSNDLFFKNTYSFLQEIELTGSITVNPDLKRSIWSEFKKLFTKIGEDRKSHNGEKNKYNFVPENAFSDYSLQDIQFI
jgi:hypothetical protein